MNKNKVIVGEEFGTSNLSPTEDFNEYEDFEISMIEQDLDKMLRPF